MLVDVTEDEAALIRMLLERDADHIVDSALEYTYGQLAELVAKFEWREDCDMPKVRHHTFVISAKQAEQRFTGFVDMLRYDRAKVIECDTGMIVLGTENHGPTSGRWQSFGLHILAEYSGDYPDISALRREAAGKLPL